MIRTVLTEGALFLSPFVAYALFLWLRRGSADHPTSWTLRALSWLTIVALLAAIAGLVAMAEYVGAPPGSTYIPAHIENGHLVPGTTK
jgi:hypothetical protein